MPPKNRKPIEQVIAGTPYPPAAFEFLQEGLAGAVHRVHGPRSEQEALIDQWMAKTNTAPNYLAELYHSHSLPREIQQMVEKAGGPERFNRHVSGQQLSWALRDLAIGKWGLMARTVLRRWGVTRTEDFGRMVFALVENDYLQAQPSDSVEDFRDVFDFEEAFSPLACQEHPAE